MAIVKQGHNLEKAEFKFDEAGEVTGIELTVNIQVYDNTADKELTRIREVKDIWGDLTGAQKTQANTIGKKLKNAGEAF